MKTVIEFVFNAKRPQNIQKYNLFPYLSINFPNPRPRIELNKGGKIYKYTVIGPVKLNFSLKIIWQLLIKGKYSVRPIADIINMM